MSRFFFSIEDKIKNKFKTTDLLGCGANACAWMTESGRVCKVTSDPGDAEFSIRRAQNKDPVLDHTLVVVDEVLKFKYRNPNMAEWVKDDDWTSQNTAYVILSEPLTLLEKIGGDDADYIFEEQVLPSDFNINQMFSITIQTAYYWFTDNLSLIPEMSYFDLISLFTYTNPILKEIPEELVEIAANKFLALLDVQEYLRIKQDETIDLIGDAHYENWGLRNAKDFKSLVLFDFGQSWPEKIRLNELPFSQWRHNPMDDNLRKSQRGGDRAEQILQMKRATGYPSDEALQIAANLQDSDVIEKLGIAPVKGKYRPLRQAVEFLVYENKDEELLDFCINSTLSYFKNKYRPPATLPPYEPLLMLLKEINENNRSFNSNLLFNELRNANQFWERAEDCKFITNIIWALCSIWSQMDQGVLYTCETPEVCTLTESGLRFVGHMYAFLDRLEGNIGVNNLYPNVISLILET